MGGAWRHHTLVLHEYLNLPMNNLYVPAAMKLLADPRMALIDLCSNRCRIPNLCLPLTTSLPLLPGLVDLFNQAHAPSGCYDLTALCVQGHQSSCRTVDEALALRQQPIARQGPVIVTLPRFKEQFKAATLNSLRYVDFTNVVVAGGIVERCSRESGCITR